MFAAGTTAKSDAEALKRLTQADKMETKATVLGTPANATPKNWQGVREASAYLKQEGVPRNFRKRILEAFDRRIIRVRVADANEFGLRYFDDVDAFADGRFTFETFPASRSSLAIEMQWNRMTKIKQWRIKKGTIIIEGSTVSQGIGLEGGQIQKFILDPKNYLEP